MSSVLTCLSNYPPPPTIPTIVGQILNVTHPNYKPDGKGPGEMISSLIVRSTFSSDDAGSLLNTLIAKDINSLDIPTVLKMKPFSSALIYSILTIVLFLILSIVFYFISWMKKISIEEENSFKISSNQHIGIWRHFTFVHLLIIIYLFVFLDMSYIAYRLSKTKILLDNTIKEINRDLYSKEIPQHANRFIRQLEELDRYSTEPTSILFNGSRSLFVKIFERIFREQYSIDEIALLISQIEKNGDELLDLIKTHKIPKTIEDETKKMIDTFHNITNSIKDPIKQMCDLATGSQTFLFELNLVHRKLDYFIQTMKNHLLNKIPTRLIDYQREEAIRQYLASAATTLFTFVIIIGLIPLVFFIIIVVLRSRNDENEQFLWLIRIGFSLIFIILIAMVLLTSVYYTSDVLVQSICRTAHKHPSYFPLLIMDEILRTNPEIKKVLISIIDACQTKTHFSRNLLYEFYFNFDEQIRNLLNKLNESILKQFKNAINQIDSSSYLDLLNMFAFANGMPLLLQKAKQIENNFINLNEQFKKIDNLDSKLPDVFIRESSNELKQYLKNVVELTTDMCPLPLDTIIKTDILVCHKLGQTFNGLWLNIFFYMFFVICGLCIFGIYIYKRFY